MDAFSPVPPFRLSLLGGFAVHWQNQPLDGFSYDKMRALLAYLSIEHGREHGREALAALLWESSPSNTWRGNLRRTLSDLRRVLEPATGLTLFDASKHSLRFLPHGQIDALRFTQAPQHCTSSPACQQCPSCIEELEQAAQLYQGDFLAGLDLPDCPDFEDWLLLQRESLRCHALALLEHLSNHCEQQGELQRALPHARRLVELDPWQEAGQQRLLRLLALNGQSAAALAHYDSFRKLLWKELGVHPSRDSQALQQRIRQGELQPQAMAPRQASLPPPPAELRQVSVLYCELSTTASSDPEEALALLAEPQARCMQVIRAHGGYAVPAHGGGLLAYFGYPRAREDAARMAVQAALALAAAGAPAQVRCGLHTGQIVTAPGQQLPDAGGFTSDLAVQVRQLAGYQQVTLSSATYRLVAGYYHCRPLSQGLLGPGASAGTIYRVEAASTARHRLAAQPQLTPLVGREPQLQLLLERWQQVSDTRRGHCLLLSADPGVGKSRLIHELNQQLASSHSPHQAELRCLEQHRSDPLFPCAELVRSLAGYTLGDIDDGHYLRLTEVLGGLGLAAEAVDLLADLLGLALPAHSPVRLLQSDTRRERTVETLLRLIHALSERQPLLLVVEDAHWADSSTLQLLQRLQQDSHDRQLFLLLSARPEFSAAPWQQIGAQHLQLPHLSPELAQSMVGELAAELQPASLQHILQLADGVPLFIEELVQWVAGNHHPEQGIPLTLNDLLMARIDQLGEARRTAQLAASIGREYHLELLQALHPDSTDTLQQHLHELLRVGLINPGSQPTLQQFKHALIQQAAYLSQPRTQRRQTHARIAEVLQQRFPGLTQQAPAQVAHHLSEAGLAEPAIAFWQRAGAQAQRISAYREAAEYFQRALDCLLTLPDGENRDRQELALQLALGTALNVADGYGAQTAQRTFSRALRLSELLADDEERFRALFGIWSGSGSQVSHARAYALGEEVLRAAEQSGRLSHRLIGHICRVSGGFWMLPLPESRAISETILALCEPQARLECIQGFGEDPTITGRTFLCLGLWIEGLPERAQQVSSELLADARRDGFAHAICFSLVLSCLLHCMLRQPQRVAELAAEALELAGHNGLQVWLDIALVMAGWARVQQGDADGLAAIQRGIEGNRRSLSSIEVSLHLLLLDAYARFGDAPALLAQVEQTLTSARQRVDNYLQPELLRLKAEALLATGHHDEVAELLLQAWDQAEWLQARSLLLRLAMTRARWLRDDNSRQLLADTLARLDEGRTTADQQEACALLAELDARPAR